MAEGVNIKIQAQIRDELKAYAKEQGVSMGAAIKLLLEKEKLINEVNDLKVSK
jgi:antitoxin component of RelBE/YafQ-DinJ toxin-antitoxin module